MYLLFIVAEVPLHFLLFLLPFVLQPIFLPSLEFKWDGCILLHERRRPSPGNVCIIRNIVSAMCMVEWLNSLLLILYRARKVQRLHLLSDLILLSHSLCYRGNGLFPS